MQIKLFPEKEYPSGKGVTIEKGQIGPIRFAATSTSYPRLCRTLAALTAKKEPPDGEIDPLLTKF